MRTRAQMSRDDALRRVTTLNRSLAVAAVVGVGVLTDVVANTATAHVRTVANGGSGYQTALLTAGGSAQHSSATHHRTSTAASGGEGEGSSGGGASGQSLQSSSAPSASSNSSAAPAPAPAPAPVVVVSGGS